MKHLLRRLRSLVPLLALAASTPAFAADFTNVALTNGQRYPNTKVIRVGENGYRYSGSAFSMVATPTAVVVVKGSATKTVSVRRVCLSGGATAAGSMAFSLTRRSTAGTLGSAALTAVTPAKLDTRNGTASATVSTVGTANYTTLGTAAGVVGSGRLTLVAIGSAATSSAAYPLCWEFGGLFQQPLVLRGTGEYLTIDGNGSAIPSGGVLDWEIETAEYSD